MGVVGCILGFLVVIYLCYKDWSVYIASIVGAAVVIAFNVLPFMDTLLGSYVNGMFVPIKSFFFLLLFGSIQSKIYSESGAAFSIADTIMSKLLRPGASNTKKKCDRGRGHCCHRRHPLHGRHQCQRVHRAHVPGRAHDL